MGEQLLGLKGIGEKQPASCVILGRFLCLPGPLSSVCERALSSFGEESLFLRVVEPIIGGWAGL